VSILDRLISRSSRSLAVMIGYERSAKGGDRERLRGGLDDLLVRKTHPRRVPCRSTSANPG
jgi:hypothetical protein